MNITNESINTSSGAFPDSCLFCLDLTLAEGNINGKK